MESYQCFHCGDEFSEKQRIVFDQKSFCCVGCKTVYEIFKQSDLTSYYDIEKNPGATPQDTKGKFDFLDNDKIVDKLLEFNEERSEEHTSELQSRPHLVCRLLLEKKKKKNKKH